MVNHLPGGGLGFGLGLSTPGGIFQARQLASQQQATQLGPGLQETYLCPKCGKTSYATYCPPVYKSATWWGREEHLEYTCYVCGYENRVPTADHG